jgi:DNA-binding XRE family transcriptional regulator
LTCKVKTTTGGETMNNLKNIRQKKKLSQKSLADKAGISRVHLTQIENGKAIPSILVARKIADALNCEIETIFFEKDVV